VTLDHTHIGQSIRLKDPKHESNKGTWMRVKDLTNDEATIVLENTDTGKVAYIWNNGENVKELFK
jgi:hypothetical protein